VQVETRTDMPLLRSSRMAPFNPGSKIIPGTSQPHRAYTYAKFIVHHTSCQGAPNTGAKPSLPTMKTLVTFNK